MTEQELEKLIISEVELIYRRGQRNEPIPYSIMADRILTLIKEAGYKSPEEVAEFIVKLAEKELPVARSGSEL